MLKQYVAFQVWLAGRAQGRSKGQSLAEYGLILALIAVLCIGVLTTLGKNIQQMLTDLGTSIGGVNAKG